MFGIGMPELLLILAVALIVIGPKKLPDLARSLGKAMGEFKRATSDLKQTIEQETGLDEVRESLRETKRDIKRSFDASDSSSSAPTASSVKEPPPDEGGPAEYKSDSTAAPTTADSVDEHGKFEGNESV